MLRVCGITYDHTINYGSCLQAYALQTAIERTVVGGSEPCSYRLIPIRTFRDWPKGHIWGRWIKLWVKAFHANFVPFEKKYLKFADVSCSEDLPALNDVSDAFVCGSDVIWNPDFNCGKKAFYLDFAKKYKFSYAASFGKTDISAENIEKVKDDLLALDSISVREHLGQTIIQQYLQKEVVVVSDPVFLLNRKDWESIADRTSRRRKYIFVYATHLSDTIKGFINRLHSDTGLDVVYSAFGPKQALKLGMVKIQSPEKWLGQLIDAEYVITNSFHATVLCLLFHKRFYTVVRGEKDKGINVRMWELLEKTGLSARLFNETPAQIDLSDVSFDAADEKLDVLRAESLQFLQRNLEAAYREKIENEQKEILTDG